MRRLTVQLSSAWWLCGALALLLAAAADGGSARSASAVSESQAPSVTRPSPREQAGLAYDTARHTLLLFGGWSSGNSFRDTWTWDGANWTLLRPVASPPAFRDLAMAYDAADSDVILVGGYGCLPSGCADMSSTWRWDGSSWSQLLPATSPPSRSGAAMGYDAATDTILLFGGSSSGRAPDGRLDLADTWTWDGSIWAQLQPAAAPSPRDRAATVYDAATGQLLLFGGTEAR